MNRYIVYLLMLIILIFIIVGCFDDDSIITNKPKFEVDNLCKTCEDMGRMKCETQQVYDKTIKLQMQIAELEAQKAALLEIEKREHIKR